MYDFIYIYVDVIYKAVFLLIIALCELICVILDQFLVEP